MIHSPNPCSKRRKLLSRARWVLVTCSAQQGFAFLSNGICFGIAEIRFLSREWGSGRKPCSRSFLGPEAIH